MANCAVAAEFERVAIALLFVPGRANSRSRTLMLKTFTFTLAGSGVVVLSAGVPLTRVIVAEWPPQYEPYAMLLLATGLFGVASAMRRLRKPPRRQR